MRIFGLGKNSLRMRFCLEAAGWSVLGLLVTLIIAAPCIWYASKLGSERQALVLAKSASRAFRGMILQDHVRDAQFQMRSALDLKPGESAVVYDGELKAIYPIDSTDSTPVCKTPLTSCWGPNYRSVSILYPIYFDNEKQSKLYGYLQLSIAPTLDHSVLFLFAILLIATFVGQAFGLSATLAGSAKQIGTTLSEWAEHLQKSPSVRPNQSAAPFAELVPMQNAVDGLHLEIAKFREQAASEAKAEAQLSLLREISHDLKTPHALVTSYFALYFKMTSSGTPKPEEVQRIEANLNRMGDLLRQVRLIPGSHADPSLSFDLASETNAIVNDFRFDPDATRKGVTIEQHIDGSSRIGGRVSKLAYFRILDNLMRNSIEAVPPGTGRIRVQLGFAQGHPTLVVSDNGCGIDPKIEASIFDFGFTTKQSRGTGLGLGIVNKLCHDHGATVSVTSVIGEGTTFTVVFQPLSIQRFTEASNG